MIKVYIENDKADFYKVVGEMNVEEVQRFVELIKANGCYYNNTKFNYIDSHYDLDLMEYCIIVIHDI